MELKRLAKIQSNNFMTDDTDLVASLGFDSQQVLFDCLSPGMAARLEDWKGRAESGTFFADIDHNVGSKGPAAGNLFPSELAHSTIFALHRNRPCTPMEKFAAHGFHVHEAVSKKWGRTPILPVLEQFTKTQQGALSGNGINLPSFLAVFCFFVAHTVAKEAEPSLIEVGEATSSGVNESIDSLAN